MKFLAFVSILFFCDCNNIIYEFNKAMEKYLPMTLSLGASKSSSSYQKEKMLRLKIFRKSKFEIDKVNRNHELPFTEEVNKFSIMTDDEKKLYTGINMSVLDRDSTVMSLKKIPELGNEKLPNYVNWVERGATTSIRDQGECGACWSFSAVTAIESTYFLTSGVLTEFSEQELIDCAYYRELEKDVCNGGWIGKAFFYTLINDRLATRRDAPYMEERDIKHCKDGNYNKPSGMKLAAVNNYYELDGDENLMIGVSQGVVAATIGFGDSFFRYQGGIWKAAEVPKDVRHAVGVVG